MLRTLVVITALVGLLAPAGAAAVAPFDSSQFYTQAEFQAAIRPYTAAVAANANDADAHYWLGVAYLQAARQYRAGLSPWAAGALAQAIQSLEKSVGLRASPGAILALSEAYVMAGEQTKALDLIVKLGEVAPPLPIK